MKPFVFAGSPAQFVNFCHAFGNEFNECKSVQDLQRASVDGRVMVILIGSWSSNPAYVAILDWLRDVDGDGRPNGQAFAMLGRPPR